MRAAGVIACALLLAGCGSTVQLHGSSPASPSAASTPTGTVTSTDRPAPSTGPIPATGRGWDSHNVYVGVLTENDAKSVSGGLGMSNLDPGNQEADATAIAAAINASGGIFGRKIVLEFLDESTFGLLADPDSKAAAACTHFTEDQPVVAVMNGLTTIDTPSFKACFQHNHLPLFSGSEQPTDTAALAGLGGYVISALSPSYTDIAPLLVARLKAEGYFTGWDVATGSSGTAPVKVGILTPLDATGSSAAQLLSAALAKAGYPPADVFSYSASGAGSGTEQNAVLQFKARGVTHVIGTGLNTYLFMTPAASQGYHPRYGVTTFNAPGVLLQSNVPKGQLTGALGIGTDPTVDVDAAHDPGPPPPIERECLATLNAAGQHFTEGRLSEAVGLFYCDVLRLLRAGAQAGHGLDAAAILRGVSLVGAGFRPAMTFTSGLGPGRYALAGSARDLGFVTSCQCFEYTSTTDYPLNGQPAR